MFRNAPEMWTARQMVESGELGEVETINVYGAGGKQMSGQGCQQFAEAFMFAGDSEIAWVVGAVDGEPGDSELGTIDEWSDHDQGLAFGFVQFKNGITVHLHKYVGTKEGVEVLGTKGALFISQKRIGKVWHKDGSDLKRVGSLFPFPDPGDAALKRNYDDEGWEVQSTRLIQSVNAFIDSVDSGAPVKCSGADLHKALELAISLRESHRCGTTRVSLPLEDWELKIIHSGRRRIGRRALTGTEAFIASVKVLKWGE